MARRVLWAQGQERRSVSGVDDLLDLCDRCWFTDIMYLAWHSGGALWNSTHFNPSWERVEDTGRGWPAMHYMDYLVARCNEVDINVHAWLTIGGYPWLWAHRSVGLPSSWNAYGSLSGWGWGNWLNMTRDDVQQAVGDAANDCCTQIAGLAGVNLDYIRVPDGASGGGITSAHITACVANAYSATSTHGLELNAAVVPHTYPGWDMDEVNQQWVSWLDIGILDTAMPMLYYTASTIQSQINYIETESANVYDNVDIGVSPASPAGSYYTVGQWLDILDTCIDNGYDMVIFDDSWLTSAYQPALEDRPITSDTPETYYIDSVLGNDANSGTDSANPWENLAKIYDVTLRPGDYIYLARGSDWDLSSIDLTGWKIQHSGTQEDPIRIEPYGAGDDPIIRNSHTYGSGATCIAIEGNYVYVDSLDIRDAAQYGILLNASYAQVNNCEISNVGIAIRINQGSHCQIYNCNIHDLVAIVADAYPTENDYGANGIGIHANAVGNMITYCTFNNCRASSYDHGFMGSAVQIHGVNGIGVDDNIVAYNHISDCWRAFTGRGAHDGNLIHSNICINNDQFMFYDLNNGIPSDFRIEHNTIVTDVSAGTPTLYQLEWETRVPTSAIVVRNNIFWTQARSITNDDSYTHTYNIYYRADGGLLGVTPGTGELNADPDFFDRAGDNLHLKVTSPAIDAGAELGYTDDYEGNTRPQGAGPDMGAYESPFVPGAACVVIYTTVVTATVMV